MQPAVGYYRYVVFGRYEYRLINRNGESEAVLVFCLPLTMHERVVEKNNFTVHIFMMIRKVSAAPYIFSSHLKLGLWRAHTKKRD